MKNTTTQRIALIIILISSISFASEKNTCRRLIIGAHTSLGEKLENESFSTTSFEQLNISVEEFNTLNSQEQNHIYMMIKPMNVMVEETINKLNRYIGRYVGTLYEMYLTDEIEAWRTYRDLLRKCDS